MPIGDESARELSAAHDVLAEVYAARLAGLLETMPIEQSILDLFGRLVGGRRVVGDLGCGTGRLAPYLAGMGLTPLGFDLSVEMVAVARREVPGVAFEVADLRALPLAGGSLDGAVCWYSLMYLAPDDRAAAYAELARVLRPGAPLALAFKAGDDHHRRGGRTLDLEVEFDIWWRSPESLSADLVAAGFDLVFWAGRPADPDEVQPQGYLVLARSAGRLSM